MTAFLILSLPGNTLSSDVMMHAVQFWGNIGISPSLLYQSQVGHSLIRQVATLLSPKLNCMHCDVTRQLLAGGLSIKKAESYYCWLHTFFGQECFILNMLCRLLFRTNTAFIIPYRMPYCVCHALFLWPSVKKLAIKLKLQKMAFCSFRTKFFFSSNSTIFITANFICVCCSKKGLSFFGFCT